MFKSLRSKSRRGNWVRRTYIGMSVPSTLESGASSSLTTQKCIRHECRLQCLPECHIFGIILTAMNSGRGWHIFSVFLLIIWIKKSFSFFFSFSFWAEAKLFLVYSVYILAAGNTPYVKRRASRTMSATPLQSIFEQSLHSPLSFWSYWHLNSTHFSTRKTPQRRTPQRTLRKLEKRTSSRATDVI